MCYNISYLTKKKLDYARRFGNQDDIAEMEKNLDELFNRTGPAYYVSGFDHPDVPVITNLEPDKIQLFSWGLIPFWVKDPAQAVDISRKTLNARGEEMFEKPSYKNSALAKRCLVVVDGFFEFHWKGDKSFPYYVHLKNGEPLALAGLWESWHYKEDKLVRNTFTIVTTRANRLMEDIHNNPKTSEGPRMPVIVPKSMEKRWLTVDAGADSGREIIRNILEPLEESHLNAYTVGKLKGKSALGNSPKALEKVNYPELI